MTSTSIQDPNGPREAATTDQTIGSVGQFLMFALEYWRGDHRRTAWLLTGAVLAIMAATLAVNLGLNAWNRWFYDALEKREVAVLWTAALWLLPLIVAGAGFAVLMVRARMALQVRWRAFVASEFLRLWLGEQRYYRLALADRSLDNAEHRIAEDVRLATEPVVELSVGFLWSLASALAFTGVLISVGGSLTVGGLWIPGYMALGAVAYATIVCGTTVFVGRPLSQLVAAKNETEAQLRYELTRVRENAESIALMHGDSREQAQTEQRLSDVVSGWLAVIRQQGHLTWILNGNAFLAPVVPALLAAPKYMSSELSLGAVMQLVAAFAAVLGALNWFAENFIRLSEIRASAIRADALRRALVALDGDGAGHGLPKISIGVSRDPNIELRNVTLKKGDGGTLVRRANIRILAGQKVLIEGKSGSGKSTLLRALAGLWPWGAGTIRLPSDAKLAFVPQRPYIPLGKLRDALSYPATDTSLTDAEARSIFEKINLPHLVPRLDEVDNWDRILSGGERQRIAFGRLLLTKPDVVVLDEATSALDDEAQAAMFELLGGELPDATVLNVAHRKGLEHFHDSKLTIDTSGQWPKLALKDIAGVPTRLANAWRHRGHRGKPAGDTGSPQTIPPAAPCPVEPRRSS